MRTITLIVGLVLLAPLAVSADDTVPQNPFLFQNSSQPIIHFNSAQTDATPVAMPLGKFTVDPKNVGFLPASLAIPGTVHKNYDDGTGAVLASTNSSVMKVRFDGGRFEKIDEILIPGFEKDHAPAAVVADLLKTMDDNYRNEDVVLPALDRYMKKYNLGSENAPNGLYTMADNEGNLYAGYGTSIFKIGDVDPSQTANSRIKILASKDVRTELPPDLAKSVSRFLGVNMTYDGYIAVAMPGLIAVMDRDLKKVYAAPIEGEAVDNGIAVDPDGGIYVVTSKYLRKLVWTGEKLSMDESDGAWKEPYPYKKDKPGMWLSRGSGATPTLMGFGKDQDKLVFIPDAGDPVRLLAFWRDEIPADAKRVEGFSSKRLAAAVPIKFPVATTIEWSPHVYGNGIMTFASDFPDPVIDGERSLFKTLLTMGYTKKAPVGADKFSWDNETNTLKRDWSYIDRSITWTLSPVSIPNNAVYLNTLQDGKWRILGFDWNTGKKVADIALPDSYKFNCAGGFIYPLPDGRIFAGGMFGPVIIGVK